MFAAAAVLGGCSGDECLQLDADCAPLYAPTFQNVFDNTLKPSCGLPGPSCHSSDGRKGGLVLAEVEEAHRLLLDGRVEPGNAACSLVMQRLESDDRGFQMPPGQKLGAPARCAIQMWIDGGALR